MAWKLPSPVSSWVWIAMCTDSGPCGRLLPPVVTNSEGVRGRHYWDVTPGNYNNIQYFCYRLNYPTVYKVGEFSSTMTNSDIKMLFTCKWIVDSFGICHFKVIKTLCVCMESPPSHTHMRACTQNADTAHMWVDLTRQLS